MRIDYRKIYKHCYGPIPIDEDGRSFDIDHIDGNYSNNHPSNLQALSIRDHYNKHYTLGEYTACQKIKVRMVMSPAEISNLARLACLERVRKGTNPFVGPKINQDRVKNGTHPWQNSALNRKTALRRSREGTLPAQIQSRNGTHHWNGGNNPVHKSIKNGTNYLIGPNNNKKRLENGTHPSQFEQTCPRCGLTGRGGTMKRWHFDNCRIVPV